MAKAVVTECKPTFQEMIVTDCESGESVLCYYLGLHKFQTGETVEYVYGTDGHHHVDHPKNTAGVI